MTEYAILVGLVAILLIAALQRLTASVGSAWDAATGRVQGEVADPLSGPRFVEQGPPAMGAPARMRRSVKGLDPPATPDGEEEAR